MDNGGGNSRTQQYLENASATTSQQELLGNTINDPEGNTTNDPVTGEAVDPLFNYTSGHFNLEYQKFIPFVIAFLIFKWFFK